MFHLADHLFLATSVITLSIEGFSCIVMYWGSFWVTCTLYSSPGPLLVCSVKSGYLYSK